MSSGYRELNAPSALYHAVEAVWLREPEFQASRSIAILPDGCMDLICRYEVGADGGAADVKLLVSGPDRSTRHMTVERGIGFVGIRFRPGWARGILDIDASPLVDVGTVAGAITPRLEALERRLLDCGSPAALQRRLENELLLGAATRRAPPSRVRAAVGRLGQPSVRVDTVADELGLTPRSLHREIVAWTGLGPNS